MNFKDVEHGTLGLFFGRAAVARQRLADAFDRIFNERQLPLGAQ